MHSATVPSRARSSSSRRALASAQRQGREGVGDREKTRDGTTRTSGSTLRTDLLPALPLISSFSRLSSSAAANRENTQRKGGGGERGGRERERERGTCPHHGVLETNTQVESAHNAPITAAVRVTVSRYMCRCEETVRRCTRRREAADIQNGTQNTPERTQRPGGRFKANRCLMGVEGILRPTDCFFPYSRHRQRP